MSEILDIFRENLPTKPYCTDNLMYGLKIRPAEIAIKKRFIQPNKPTDLGFLVYDIDRPTAIYDWHDMHCPTPNFIVINPENGNGHYFFALEVPVYMQMGANNNPIRYAAAVDVAMIHKLQSDPNYARLISKNPLNAWWNVHVLRDESYTLEELASWLDLGKMLDKRTKLEPIGLGRNCTMFDDVRHWAYREVRKPPEPVLFPDIFYSLEGFIAACTQKCRNEQINFPVPLPDSEIRSTGKSIAKWTYYKMSPASFRQWCSNRGTYGGKKSGIVRAEKAQTQKEKAIELLALNPQLTKADLSLALGCSLSTIQKYDVVRTEKASDKKRQIQAYKKAHPTISVRELAKKFDVSIGSVSNYLS